MKDALATDLNTRLLEDANNSVDLLMDLRNDPDQKSELRAKIAMDLLDRATIRHTEHTEVSVGSDGVVDRVRKRAAKAKLINVRG